MISGHASKMYTMLTRTPPTTNNSKNSDKHNFSDNVIFLVIDVISNPNILSDSYKTSFSNCTALYALRNQYIQLICSTNVSPLIQYFQKHI